MTNSANFGTNINNRFSHWAIIFLFLFSQCSHTSEINWEELEDYEDDTVEEQKTEEESTEKFIAVPYKEKGGVICLPVSINNVGLEMIFDTGASTTLITIAEAEYLYNKGTLTDEDLVDFQLYETADGGIAEGVVINIRKLVIGNEIELKDIEAIVVANQSAPLLLGQSVLSKFQKIEVDRARQEVKFY